MKHRILMGLAVALAALVWATAAPAEIVFLTSGRTISVKSYKVTVNPSS